MEFQMVYGIYSNTTYTRGILVNHLKVLLLLPGEMHTYIAPLILFWFRLIGFSYVLRLTNYLCGYIPSSALLHYCSFFFIVWYHHNTNIYIEMQKKDIKSQSWDFNQFLFTVFVSFENSLPLQNCFWSNATFWFCVGCLSLLVLKQVYRFVVKQYWTKRKKDIFHSLLARRDYRFEIILEYHHLK